METRHFSSYLADNRFEYSHSPSPNDVVAALDRGDGSLLRSTMSTKTKKAVLEVVEKGYNCDSRQMATIVFRVRPRHNGMTCLTFTMSFCFAGICQ